MSDYRFYVPDLLKQLSDASALTQLPEDEAHHARAVLRLEKGASIVLFDGKGAWAVAKIEHVSKREVRARVSEPPIREEKPPIELTLCTAVPKGERADWLIEQASQLNVAAVQWLNCERGVVKPREGGGKIEKWRRLAVESSKQCGRLHLMEIREPFGVEAMLRDVAGRSARALWLDPGPGGASVGEALAGFTRGTVAAFIGPEGGWSDSEHVLLEREVAAEKMHRIRLTSTVLRIETACAAVGALVMGEDVPSAAAK